MEEDQEETSVEAVRLASEVVGFLAASVAQVEAVVSGWMVQVAAAMKAAWAEVWEEVWEEVWGEV